ALRRRQLASRPEQLCGQVGGGPTFGIVGHLRDERIDRHGSLPVLARARCAQPSKGGSERVFEATTSTRRVKRSALCLGPGLLLLLVGADRGEAVGAVDVGDRVVAGLTVRAGGLLLPLRLDAQALREERGEDARLLLTEPRQLAQVGHQLVARRRARPDPAGITVVLLDDAPAQLL